MARNTLIHQIADLDCPVQIFRNGKNSFTVVYGKQVKSGLTREQAAEEYGYCMMHSAECCGLLD